jgi:hypothetical protein
VRDLSRALNAVLGKNRETQNAAREASVALLRR